MAGLSTSSAHTRSLPTHCVQQCRASIRPVQPCRLQKLYITRQVVTQAGEGAPASTTQTATTPTQTTAGWAAQGAAPQAAPGQASQQDAAKAAPANPSLTPDQQKPKNAMSGLDQRFRDAYTMSQVYVKDRPAPIPLSEYERRRKARDLEEITAAGKRRGVSAETIKANLEQVESLLPGLVNLHKAKAADWVTIIKDVNMLMTKVLIIKDTFPGANLHKIVTSQPRLLLKSEADLRQDGQKVRTILAGAPDAVDIIIETVPDLINPVSLVRSLSYIKSSFGGVDPVELIAKHPDVLLNMGEASIEDSAEYGELSTKD